MNLNLVDSFGGPDASEVKGSLSVDGDHPMSIADELGLLSRSCVSETLCDDPLPPSSFLWRSAVLQVRVQHAVSRPF